MQLKLQCQHWGRSHRSMRCFNLSFLVKTNCMELSGWVWIAALAATSLVTFGQDPPQDPAWHLAWGPIKDDLLTDDRTFNLEMGCKETSLNLWNRSRWMRSRGPSFYRCLWCCIAQCPWQWSQSFWVWQRLCRKWITCNISKHWSKSQGFMESEEQGAISVGQFGEFSTGPGAFGLWCAVPFCVTPHIKGGRSSDFLRGLQRILDGSSQPVKCSSALGQPSAESLLALGVNLASEADFM